MGTKTFAPYQNNLVVWPKNGHFRPILGHKHRPCFQFGALLVVCLVVVARGLLYLLYVNYTPVLDIFVCLKFKIWVCTRTPTHILPPAPPFPSFHLNPAPSQLFPGLTHFQPIRAKEGFVSTNQERESIARSSNEVRVGSVCLLGPEREGKSPLGVVGNEATRWRVVLTQRGSLHFKVGQCSFAVSHTCRRRRQTYLPLLWMWRWVKLFALRR